MSYEIVKKVVIKKGKTISITRESNNVTPKHFKAYKSDYNYLLDMIYSFVSGNFRVAGKDESVCKLENVIDKIKGFLKKETEEKKLLQKDKYFEDRLESYIIYFSKEYYKYVDDKEFNKELIEKVIEIFEKEYFSEEN